MVRNNAFPVWEELVEVMVRSPDDQITVQLLAEPNFATTSSTTAGSGGAAVSAANEANEDDDENTPIPGVGDETRRLSQKLRVPHYDKRFCCNREVSLNLAPFAHSPLLAAQLEAAGASASRPLMLRLKATWEESEQDRKLKAKQMLKQQRRQSATALKTSGGLFNGQLFGGRPGDVSRFRPRRDVRAGVRAQWLASLVVAAAFHPGRVHAAAAQHCDGPNADDPAFARSRRSGTGKWHFSRT